MLKDLASDILSKIPPPFDTEMVQVSDLLFPIMLRFKQQTYDMYGVKLTPVFPIFGFIVI